MKKICLMFLLISTSCLLCSCLNNNDKAQVVVYDSIKSNSTKIESESYLSLKANLAYKSRGYFVASKLYSSLICKDSANGEFVFKKGVCCAKLGCKADAIKYYKKAVYLKYRVPDSYMNISIAYASLLNDSLALVYINKCISLDPNNQKALELEKLFTHISKSKKKGKNVDI